MNRYFYIFIANGLFFTSLSLYASDNLVPMDLNEYPPEIINKVNEIRSECDSAFIEEYHDKIENALVVYPGFIIRSDLTGDGIYDYVVTVGKTSCKYLASIWGRFPYFEVYAGTIDYHAFPILYGENGDPDNYPRVVTNDSGFFDIQYAGSGEVCEQEGEYSFAELEYCEVTLHWDKNRKEFEIFDTGALFENQVEY